jgi:tetratricopeptide (TPR) repeat protein
VHDPAWRDHLSTIEVDGLPMTARLQLLASSGITDSAQQLVIASASDGLPFYLHLAVDTGLGPEPATPTPLVSSEEILQRFLAHVDSDDIRVLELLSLTRTFDHEVFRGLSEAFDLPGHRMAWEALASYSFVYPAGPTGLRLHQVMATALQGRLSGDAAGEVHAVLRRLLDDRAARPRPASADIGGDVPVAALLREAAYHGLWAGEISGAELLDYGDRARLDGGTQALDGMLTDLREFLDHDQADHDGRHRRAALADTAVCLAAEAAILRGDAAAAAELVPDIPAQVDGVVPARLAIATAQARRISGETAAALEGYTAVWERHRGPARLTAGLWAADLHMCQGRFRLAEQMAVTLEADSPPDWVEFGGDVARLRYLGFRFALDYDTARIHLDEAERRYVAAGSYIGRANIQTNRAELLSLTDPAAALSPARQAIETQSEIGAGHEVGKAYTALAVAQLRLGHLDDADGSLRSACDELERAGYRSGRARAELFRAVLAARRGDLPAAHASAQWTVRELETAQVYPTLIMAATHAVERLGIADEQLQAAAGRARTAIDAVDSLAALEARITAAVTDLLGGSP